MNRTLLSTSLILLSSPLLAQSTLTTPPTGTSVDGNDAAFIFGWAANQKHRLMDATHAGTSRSIKALQFRADYRDHSAIGRTWSKVTIHAGHADFSSISINKSTYYKAIDTPAKVFDAKWSFPALSGKPLLNPASWGGVKSSLNFSFSKPFAYNGKSAIFVEFNFTGGVAANGAKWAELGDTPKGFEYFLDTMTMANWGGTPGKGGSMSLPARPTACYDSAFSGKLGATPYMKLTDAATVELSVYTYYTAPKGNVVYAIGLGGNATGVNIGGACNRFHVDPTNGMALFTASDKSGKGYTARSFKATKASWMKEFWAQAAWEDSKTKAFKLTHAVGAKLGTSTGKLIPAATSYQAGGKINVWTQTKGLPYMRWVY